MSDIAITPILNQEFESSNKLVHGVAITSQNISYLSIPATSGSDTANLRFHADIPTNTLVQSNIKIRLPWQLKVSGDYQIKGVDGSNPDPAYTATQVEFLDPSFACLSKNAFFNLINTYSVTINSQTITINPREWHHAITDYLPVSDDKNSELTMWSNQPDYSSTFQEQLVSEGGDYSSSPFSPSMTTNKWGKRSLYYYNFKKYNANGTAEEKSLTDKKEYIISGEFVMPLLCKPFSACDNTAPLAHLSRINIDIQLSDEWPKLINRTESANYAVATVNKGELSWTSTPTLLLQTAEIPPPTKHNFFNPEGEPIPQEYAFNNIVMVAPSGYTSIPNGQSAELTTNSHILTTTPVSAYVFAEREGHNPMSSNSLRDWIETPESFGLIESLQVSLNNRIHNFNDTSQLYAISAREGLQIPYQAALKSGFVIKLDFAKHLSCGDLMPGAVNKSNLVIKARVRNPRQFVIKGHPSAIASAKNEQPSHQKDFKVRLCCALVSPAVLKIGKDYMTIRAVTLNEEDRKKIMNANVTSYRHDNPVVFGAGTRGGSDMFNTGGGVFDWLKKIAEPVAKVADVVGTVARSVSGAGDSSKMTKRGGTDFKSLI